MSMKILVVEDNVDSAETIKMLLELSGHKVTLAHCGADGLSAAEKQAPDVMFCDIGLPGEMDGYAVAKACRKHQKLASLYMVALTGFGQSEDHEQALDAGFNMHITKPVDPAVLEKVIAEYSRINLK